MTREEAIEVIKAKADYLESDKRFRAAVETIIPELKESEDERVRKDIIKILNSLPGCYWYGQKEKDDCLAYLEKQKETGIRWFKSDNVKNPNKSYIDKAGMFYTTDGRMCYASEIEKQKECLADNSKTSANEDERIRKAIVGLIEELQRSDKNFAGVELADMLAYMEKQKEQKPAEWDKLQEVFRNINEAFEDGKKEVVAHPKKYGLCKPIEWSKEDEEMLRTVIYDLERHDRDAYAAEIKWLKCLDERFNLQPKQEWNEDKNKLDKIHSTVQRFIKTIK